jgi:hypothetical protein
MFEKFWMVLLPITQKFITIVNIIVFRENFDTVVI